MVGSGKVLTVSRPMKLFNIHHIAVFWVFDGLPQGPLHPRPLRCQRLIACPILIGQEHTIGFLRVRDRRFSKQPLNFAFRLCSRFREPFLEQAIDQRIDTTHKKLATEATFAGEPPFFTRRSKPASDASMTSW